MARRPGGHPHDREILRLGVPALGQLVAEPLYILADTAVVGHLGTPQLGGLAVASAVLLTGYALFIFLAYGTTAAVARLLGAGDERRAAEEAVQSLWLAVGLGSVVAAGAWIFAGPLVDVLGASESVRPHALTYLRISLIGFPALLVTLAGTGYLRGLQDTKTPLVVAAATAVGNLAIELVLIPGLGYGIGASALSTVIAQGAGAAVYLWFVTRSVRGTGASVRPHAGLVWRQAIVGRDLFIRTAALRGSLTLGTAVAARIGVVELGAHQIAYEVWSFLALVLDAIAIAGQAMIGRLLGAGRPKEAFEAGRRMLEWGVGLGLALGAVLGLASPWLPTVFTGDPEVRAVGTFLLLWVAGMQPVNAVVFVLDGVLIGAGDQRYLAWAMVGAAVAFAPLALLVGVLDLGIGWLWAAVVVLMLARMLPLVVRFARGGWVVTGADRAG